MALFKATCNCRFELESSFCRLRLFSVSLVLESEVERLWRAVGRWCLLGMLPGRPSRREKRVAVAGKEMNSKTTATSLVGLGVDVFR